MKKIVTLLIIALMVFSLAACSNDESTNSDDNNKEKVFKIGGIPDQNASKLNRRFEDLAKYIGEETGLTVEYVPTVDYSALVTAFERGEIHLGWFGGLTGVQARNVVDGAEAIAQRPRDEEFHSVFIAQKDLELKKLTDVKGLSFTFGSESSTSGHLMPRHFLIEEGLDPKSDFDGQVNFSGSHDKTWKLVESGAFQTGALNEAVWESAVEEGKVDLDKVSVFYTTPAYYDYNWTINNVDKDFGKGTKEEVKEALLSVGEDQKEIMELFEADKFIETKNENYEAIKSVAKKLGIIK
ncbi:putative selenate ABC transporter substrate-binding protein [Clostridium sp. D2Q-11]|uniref:Selenate ABC transporter substrate-binding protein n=1 Tax=Anaeromonas frigoriresistens TaxID=2683708 RepID=A0A942UUF6_9FIRM|nr:putative selenate ABC transporter substrate-binding protein [Anaeromonas frigoriresistens]MBS4539328.1 putative selenate ABC transporter substrate-binding protein [Anaeromonas frigoriresistens]